MTVFPSKRVKHWTSGVVLGGGLFLCYVCGFVCLFDWFLSSAEWKFRRALSSPWVTQEPPCSFVYSTWAISGGIFKLFHQSQAYSLHSPKSRKGVKEGECTASMTVAGTRKHLVPKPCVCIHL